MDPEWPLAERHVDDAHDLAGDFRRIGVGGLKAGEALQRPVSDPSSPTRRARRRCSSPNSAVQNLILMLGR
jgi:hypothetical protein